jgi:LuxR family transcriptional regulator, maltose regulon positive regulatory protein
LGRIEEDRGFLFRAAELYRQAIQLAEQKAGARGGPQFLAKWAYRSLAEVLREQNKLAEAKRYLTLSIELESQIEVSDIPTAVSHLILAGILQVEGDAADAQDAIQLAAHFHTAEESPVFHWVGAIQARLWLAQGHLTEAVHWAETCGLPLDEQFNYHLYPGEYASLARVWLAQSRPKTALALLAQMQSAAQSAGQGGRLVEIYLLQALALSAQGQTEAALTVLDEALVLGEIGGYIRLFADEGVPMAELLLAASRRPLKVNRVYLDQLLAAFPRLQTAETVEVAPLPGVIRQPPSSPLVEPLSDRELELLRLVAVGLSNQDIADRLVIAEGTVKKHLHNIFGKLEARSRTQAIVRATQLNLL